MRFKSIGIAIAMLCSLLFTPCVFAQLAIDDHAANNIGVAAEVSIDSLSYDPSGAGVAYLSSTFALQNFDDDNKCFYTGELRLEILKPKGDGTYFTYIPDAKEPISGSLENATKHWSDTYIDMSESTSLYIDCLSGLEEIIPGMQLTMSASITLNATIGGTTETWAINNPTYKSDFTHEPETDEEEIHGLGPTKDGETFSDDCTCNFNNERDWQSLVITDTLYSSVYWYVKAPGDTSAHGTHVETDWGDGVERNATMTYSFPDDVGGPGEEAAYYEITAYVYRWDQTVYWDSYKVWVHDN
jgi:hypothetical protein